MSDTLDRLAEENPNIGEHLRDWQIARTQNNEDAYDWTEFRQHELRLGAPDPGETEPDEFRQYNWTLYVPSSAGGSGNAGQAAAEQKSATSSESGGGGTSGAGASAGASGGGSSQSSWQGHTEEPAKAKGSLFDFLRAPFGRR
ncbi:MAG: hypothetical protein U0556_16735 [Dehalococcoidia bacterium]